MAKLSIFEQKCFIWVFLGKNFKNTIVIFEISILKFVYLQNFRKKQKYQNLGPKMPHLGILGLEFENNIVIFEIITPGIYLVANLAAKQKCVSLGPKMPNLGIFEEEF